MSLSAYEIPLWAFNKAATAADGTRLSGSPRDMILGKNEDWGWWVRVEFMTGEKIASEIECQLNSKQYED